MNFFIKAAGENELAGKVMVIAGNACEALTVVKTMADRDVTNAKIFDSAHAELNLTDLERMAMESTVR